MAAPTNQTVSSCAERLKFAEPPKRVSVSGCVRAGTESRPYRCTDLFSSQPKRVSVSGCVWRAWKPPLRRLTSDYLSLRHALRACHLRPSRGAQNLPRLERGQILTASPPSPRFFRHRRRFGDGARQREERLHLPFGFITAETCVRVGLCSGGHGVPPLRLLEFYFLRSRNVCPRRAVFYGGSKPPPYGAWFYHSPQGWRAWKPATTRSDL